MNRDEEFKKEAFGVLRSLFVFFEKAYGFTLTPQEQIDIAEDACRDAANHINRHRIFQRTFDGLKLTSFLVYHASVCLHRTRSHGAHTDPVRTACKAGIERLSRLLKVETSNEMVVTEKDQGYLTSMLYDEVISRERCTSGIGPNGLSTVFTFLQRLRPDADRLGKV